MITTKSDLMQRAKELGYKPGIFGVRRMSDTVYMTPCRHRVANIQCQYSVLTRLFTHAKLTT